MNRPIWILAAALMAGASLAQTLQHRSPSGTVASAPVSTDARRALPLAAEGEYRWGEPGEVIELYVEDGALRGYLTRRSERHLADSAPMTFAFVQAVTMGSDLSFATKHIHGDWYSFTGRVMRGSVPSRRQDGYYLLQGTLTAHLGPDGTRGESLGESSISKQVILKLSAGGPGAN